MFTKISQKKLSTISALIVGLHFFLMLLMFVCISVRECTRIPVACGIKSEYLWLLTEIEFVWAA